MKKIMTGLMFLAIALFVCSGFIAAPAMAVEGVIKCRVDADCDNGLDSFCTSIPFCNVGGGCDDSECDGVCTFIDPCAQYPHAPVCDQLSQFNDERACVECVEDITCRQFLNDGDDFGCGEKDALNTLLPQMVDFAGACIDNTCFECVDNGDCLASGAECIDGACIECDEDADCEEGELCRDGYCCGEAVPGPVPECYPENNQDSDVNFPGLNSACKLPHVNGVFCTQYGTCLEDGTCDNGSDQCQAIGQYCVEDDAKCAWCIEDADCDGWECDDYPETTGPYCNGQADCTQPPECATDDDCAATFCDGIATCVDGECTFVDPAYDPCAAEAIKTECDELNDRCAECAIDADCPNDEESTCNGTAVCQDDGTCGYTGTQCPSGQCLPVADLCYDCEDNADCANFFTGKPVCVTVYDEDSNPNTNYCAECLLDTDCANGFCLAVENDPKQNQCVDCIVDADCEGTQACVSNSCVECDDDCDCPVDSPFCTGSPADLIAVAGAGPGCDYFVPYNVCVECYNDTDCPTGDTCWVADCPDCVDIYDECGNYSGRDCGEGTAVNECVECLSDEDCYDRLRELDDPFAACKVDGVCDNNTNTCSYSNPCGQLECFPAGYYNSEDFGKVTQDCDDSDCPTFDYYCADCANDEACMDNLYCNGVESCSKEGCVAGVSPCAEGLLCQESTDSCLAVDCLEDTDCMFYEECDQQNECQEIQATCGLKINPKQMKANKLFARDSWTFKIQALKGQSGFDPNAPKYFGEQITEIESVVKKGKLKVQVKGDSENPINPGILDIWVGTCKGTVVLK